MKKQGSLISVAALIVVVSVLAGVWYGAQYEPASSFRQVAGEGQWSWTDDFKLLTQQLLQSKQTVRSEREESPKYSETDSGGTNSGSTESLLVP